jgi:serine/threonine protein kinase
MAYRVRWCENVVHPVAVFSDNYSFFIVQELAPGGSLQALLDGGGPLPEAEAAQVLRGVLESIDACHLEGICYGGARLGPLPGALCPGHSARSDAARRSIPPPGVASLGPRPAASCPPLATHGLPPLRFLPLSPLDVKPANFMLMGRLDVRMVDFGCSRVSQWGRPMGCLGGGARPCNLGHSARVTMAAAAAAHAPPVRRARPAPTSAPSRASAARPSTW